MQYVTRKNVKKVVVFIVSKSTGFAAGTLVHQAVVVEKNRNKFSLLIGATVIGWMVSDQAEIWADKEMDELYAMYDEYKNRKPVPTEEV